MRSWYVLVLLQNFKKQRGIEREGVAFGVWWLMHRQTGGSSELELALAADMGPCSSMWWVECGTLVPLCSTNNQWGRQLLQHATPVPKCHHCTSVFTPSPVLIGSVSQASHMLCFQEASECVCVCVKRRGAGAERQASSSLSTAKPCHLSLSLPPAALPCLSPAQSLTMHCIVPPT